MYVQPDGKLNILKGVPLEPTFEHTILFDSLSAQANYFTGQSKYKLNDMSYTRYGRGVIRVNVTTDNLYDCNYIMFQNTAFGSKWFYAFIMSVEYVSNTVSEISFLLDPMQTWHFDYTLPMCFIERCHTVTDEYGENLVDEGLEIGDVLNGKYTFGSGWNLYNINVVSAFDPDEVINNDNFAVADGGFYAGIYSGFGIQSFDAQSVMDVFRLGQFLDKIVDGNRASSVLGIFMCPQWMVAEKKDNEKQSLPNTREIILSRPYGYAFSYANRGGSYTPKNKKLYNYPYCSLMVSNGDGDRKLYKWENFVANGNNVAFSEIAMFSASVSAVTVPIDYGFDANYRATYQKNPNDVTTYRTRCNFEEALYMTDFPMCAFSVDSYRAWLAQKKTVLPYEIGGFLLSQAGSAVKVGQSAIEAQANTNIANATASAAEGATGSTVALAQTMVAQRRAAASAAKGQGLAAIAGMVADTAGFVLEQMKQNAAAHLLPEGTNGTLSGNGASTSLRQKRFTYTNRMIKGEYAMMIDAYFTMFGYKVNAVARPNRDARPHFTYLKTVNCQINPAGNRGIPQDDVVTICNIYNNGITFWKNPTEVGNYNLDNSPR